MTERRYAELRQGPGRTLEGVAIRYGDVAALPWGQERFEPGAFGEVATGDVILNVAHDRARPIARTGGGGLALADSADALTIRADLPVTREADDALALVRAGVLRGLSVEFLPIAERTEGTTRVIERATLAAIGLVDTGAYPGSTVEARRRKRGKTMTADIPADRDVECRCAGAACKFARYSAELMQAEFDRAFAKARLILFMENYGQPLASAARGTLRRTGPLSIAADLPEGPAGDALAAANEAVGLVVRPFVDPATAVIEETGEVAVYREFELRALVATATDARDGWEPVEIADVGEAPKARRRVWL